LISFTARKIAREMMRKSMQVWINLP